MCNLSFVGIFLIKNNLQNMHHIKYDVLSDVFVQNESSKTTLEKIETKTTTSGS